MSSRRIIWLWGDPREEPTKIDLDEAAALKLEGGPIEVINERHWKLPPGSKLTVVKRVAGD